MSYRSLLGEYFTIVSHIAALETNQDPDELTSHEKYQILLEERNYLERQLDTEAESKANSDLEQTLDEAFKDL